MPNNIGRNITTLIGDLPVSHKLKSSSKVVSPIADKWLELIEQPLSAHSIPSHFEGMTLTIAVDGPVWATEFRHNIPSILRKLHVLGHNQILKIKIILQPKNIGPIKQKHTKRESIDTNTLIGIAHNAEYVKEEILAKALKSLAKTLNSEHK